MHKEFKGQPTRWTYISEFQAKHREWLEVREALKEATLEGRISIKQYLVDLNPWYHPKTQRVLHLLEQSLQAKSIRGYLGSHSRQVFKDGEEAMERILLDTKVALDQANNLPLEATPGYQFNLEFHISEKEIKYAIEHEGSYDSTLLTF